MTNEAPQLPPSTSIGGVPTLRVTADSNVATGDTQRVVHLPLPHGSGRSAMGRYVVVDTLGTGAMGTVMRAFDRQLDRPVALKVLHPETDACHTTRLRREAQALAKLSHPNVVQVYEIGEAEGCVFVAMELVKGQTLGEWMSQEPRPDWRACLQMVAQLGDGLAAAHECGLVHRDFKPSNAIIDDKGRPRILDFGLARRADDDELDVSPACSLIEQMRSQELEAVPLAMSLTDTGSVMGTPAYMPPEQLNGAGVDPRSDQFSFCVALYEALYGERPFRGRTLGELTASVIASEFQPAPPDSTVPAAVREAVLRGLAVDPEQRWPSMEALLIRLRELLAAEQRRPRSRLANLASVIGLRDGGVDVGSRALPWLWLLLGVLGLAALSVLLARPLVLLAVSLYVLLGPSAAQASSAPSV